MYIKCSVFFSNSYWLLSTKIYINVWHNLYQFMYQYLSPTQTHVDSCELHFISMSGIICIYLLLQLRLLWTPVNSSLYQCLASSVSISYSNSDSFGLLWTPVYINIWHNLYLSLSPTLTPMDSCELQFISMSGIICIYLFLQLWLLWTPVNSSL